MSMDNALKFLIVDDDIFSAKFHCDLLSHAGYQVEVLTSSQEALDKIQGGELQVDVILSDMIMPQMDGLDFFKQVRAIKNIKQPIFVIITGKVFEYDRRRAFESGVDGYLLKPVDPTTFVEELSDIINHTMCVQFWGVRGTLPVPGENSVRYGGNTNCVTLMCGKKHFCIFDAGTGIKALSNYLIEQHQMPIAAKIFISHPHYDHINGFPFFTPLYMNGNTFDIYGSTHADIGIEKLLSDQMDSIYFPITMQEFSAKLNFHDLSEGTIMIDDMTIDTLFLNHPGRCLGYRLTYNNKIFCYVTDNELYLETSPHYNQYEVDRLQNFVQDADLLVIDATYTDEEYAAKEGWGHSCVSRVVDVANRARVKVLCLYHHDPSQTDEDIDRKLEAAKTLLQKQESITRCIAAHEGQKIFL